MANSNINVEELRRERGFTENKLRMARAQLEDMRARIKSTSSYFDLSKEREKQLFEELKRENQIQSDLMMKKSTLEATSRESEDIRDRLNEAR